MDLINFKLIAVVMLFIILISIHLTLNKILLVLKEIRDNIKASGFDSKFNRF
ncbi:MULTISPECIES: hypothetical protein [Peptostreptococcus]|uniref:hypothetical protein n=1 Tax=Peptostreptococcus TaxID=1257 RepID=UPI0015A5EAB0|nr:MULTISPECIES: hypothetical protein [Peptostreptococcus]MDD7182675.1 hypothetical protein [Peptostreptococcus porci]MDY2794850.1 hypothetical protein [Peptostreptococcus porci]MDY4128467.1 hypothetical protein [Peptostreptococcus porci]MDY5435358.1 hypothetical protein [Peptostreptococcus porci]MDY5480157.1 hypothetical protein [Peptostreptococcus porci]